MQSGNRILMNIEYFDLEVDLNCAYDYLLVRDGANFDSPIIGRLCGPSPYISSGVLYSSGKDLRIEFHSDMTTSKGGFRLSWKAITQTTLPTTPKPTTTEELGKHKIMTGELRDLIKRVFIWR